MFPMRKKKFAQSSGVRPPERFRLTHLKTLLIWSTVTFPTGATGDQPCLPSRRERSGRSQWALIFQCSRACGFRTHGCVALRSTPPLQHSRVPAFSGLSRDRHRSPDSILVPTPTGARGEAPADLKFHQRLRRPRRDVPRGARGCARAHACARARARARARHRSPHVHATKVPRV